MTNQFPWINIIDITFCVAFDAELHRVESLCRLLFEQRVRNTFGEQNPIEKQKQEINQN